MKFGKIKLAKVSSLTVVDVLHVAAAAALAGLIVYFKHGGGDVTVDGLAVGHLLVTALAAFNKGEAPSVVANDVVSAAADALSKDQNGTST